MKKIGLIAFWGLLWGFFKYYDDPSGDWAEKNIDRIDIIGELAIYILAFIVAFLFYLRRAISRKAFIPNIIFEGSVFYITIFYLVAIISSLYTFLPLYSFYRGSQFLIFILFVGFFVEDYDKNPQKSLNFNLLIYFAIINFIWIVLSFYWFPDLIGYEERGIGGAIRYRIMGGFPFRRDFGLVPLIISIISMSKYFNEKKVARKVAYLVSTLLGAYFIVLYESRSIQIAVIASIVFLLVGESKMNFSLFYLTSGFCIIFYFVDQKWDLLNYIFRFQSIATLSGRLTTWRYSLLNLSQVPFYGYGFLATPFVFAIPQFVGEVVTLDTHNSLLESFYNTGYLGLILTIIIFIRVAKEIIVDMKLNCDQSEHSLMVRISALKIGILFSLIFSNGLASPINLGIQSLIITSTVHQNMKKLRRGGIDFRKRDFKFRRLRYSKR